MKNAELPFQIEHIDDDLNKQLLNDYNGERTGFVQVGPERYFFPSKFAKEAQHYYNFKVKPDDTWVITFPRSGTTWTQELVWLIANNLNFKKASSVPLANRFPFLEFSTFIHEELKEKFLKENEGYPDKLEIIKQIICPAYETLNEMTEPRFIKTHLPFSLLPPHLLETGCKVIYVARNPKDVAVSYYHLNKLFKTQGFKGDFEKHWDYFERNLNAWTPYWSHIKEGWNHRHHPNVLFLFYENMNKELGETLHTVADFLGKSLTKDDVQALKQYLDIKNFKQNRAVNFQSLKEVGILNNGAQGFIRKGITGGWSEEFTPQLNQRADKWINENLGNTDLRFPGIC
ncbi:sulfotransferase 4 [Lycorma delicatula]|uniref:sulfotransferase 4 n=1 Tax=Lycorma delicatula TaxID=130591 RepID=UPI003F5178E0